MMDIKVAFRILCCEDDRLCYQTRWTSQFCYQNNDEIFRNIIVSWLQDIRLNAVCCWGDYNGTCYISKNIYSCLMSDFVERFQQVFACDESKRPIQRAYWQNCPTTAFKILPLMFFSNSKIYCSFLISLLLQGSSNYFHPHCY